MKVEKERVSVEEAAKILGMAPYMVRHRMKKKTLNIGEAISPEKNGTSRWEFRIWRHKLCKEIGMDTEELQRGGEQKCKMKESSVSEMHDSRGSVAG